MNQPRKRQYRELSDETKAKISQTQRNKPPRPQWWRDKQSQAMIDYWRTIPYRDGDGDGDGDGDDETGEETE